VCSGVSTCDFTSISAAIYAANENDVILVQPGAYTELGIRVNKPLTITAMGEVQVSMPSDSFTWLTVASPLVLNGATFTLNNAGLLIQAGGLIQDATLKVNSNGSAEAAFQIVKFYSDRELPWTQNGDLLINVKSEETSAHGIEIWGGVTWTQKGDIHINITSNLQFGQSGIALYAGGGSVTQFLWKQLGNVFINHNGGHSVDAIHVGGPYNSFSWIQTGLVVINVTTTAMSALIKGFSSTSAGSATWTQNGDVHIVGVASGSSSTAIGTQTNELNTIQTGNMHIDLTSEIVHGFYLGGTWTQNGSLSLLVKASNSSSGVFFLLSLATWRQHGNANIAVKGQYSTGVDFNSKGGPWLQYGTVGIQVDGDYSCGVDTGAWPQGVSWKRLGVQPVIAVYGAGSLGICGQSAPAPSSSPSTGGSTTGTPSGDRSTASGLWLTMMAPCVVAVVALLI